MFSGEALVDCVNDGISALREVGLSPHGAFAIATLSLIVFDCIAAARAFFFWQAVRFAPNRVLVLLSQAKPCSLSFMEQCNDSFETGVRTICAPNLLLVSSEVVFFRLE